MASPQPLALHLFMLSSHTTHIILGFEEIIYSSLYNGFMHKPVYGYTVYAVNCTWSYTELSSRNYLPHLCENSVDTGQWK